MPRKKKTKTIIIEMNPYDTDLIVQYGGTMEELRESLKEITNQKPLLEFLEENKEGFETDLTTRARTFLLPFGFAIWFAEDATAPTVAHEVLHVIQELFRKVGVGCTPDTDEAWAYLLEKTMKDITTTFKI